MRHGRRFDDARARWHAVRRLRPRDSREVGRGLLCRLSRRVRFVRWHLRPVRVWAVFGGHGAVRAVPCGSLRRRAWARCGVLGPLRCRTWQFLWRRVHNGLPGHNLRRWLLLRGCRRLAESLHRLARLCVQRGLLTFSRRALHRWCLLRRWLSSVYAVHVLCWRVLPLVDVAGVGDLVPRGVLLCGRHRGSLALLMPYRVQLPR